MTEMDIKHIKDRLSRLAAVADKWEAEHEIPAIERQIALDALASLYEEIKFGEMPQPESANPDMNVGQPSHEDEEGMAAPIDLTGFFTARDEAEEKPEAQEAAPVAAVVLEVENTPAEADTIQETEPIHTDAAPEGTGSGVSLPDIEFRVTDVEVSHEPASGQVQMPEQQPEVEPQAPQEPRHASDQGTADATVSETAGGTGHTAEDAGVNGHPDVRQSEAEDSSDDSAIQTAAGQSALFDLDSIKRLRNNRRIIISLYGEAESAAPQNSRDVAAKPAEKAMQSEKTATDIKADTDAAAPAENSGEQYPAATVPEDDAARPVSPTDHIEPEMPHESRRNIEPSAAQHPAEPSAPLHENRPRPVLGEIINAGTKTVGEAMAETPKHDITEKIVHSDRIHDLNQAIGINDKFIMIRDLFNGDGERYNTAIAELNRFENFDECLIYIASHYRWDPNCDGAKMLMEVLSRKLM